MNRLLPLLLTLGCVEAPTMPAASAALPTVDLDTTAIITEVIPLHPIHVIWEKPPTPDMQAAWDRAAERWGRALIPRHGRDPYIVTEDSPCLWADWAFSVGDTVRSLTVIIRARDVPDHFPATGAECEHGVSGNIGLSLRHWVNWREDHRNHPYYMEKLFIHEIGHILGIGSGWRWLDDDGNVIRRGGHWGGRITVVRSTVRNSDSSVAPDTVDWPYFNDPDIAGTLEELTDGRWTGAMIPLDEREQHWHWCLTPFLRDCLIPDENNPNICYGSIVGGDVMGTGGRITRITLKALDPELWTAGRAEDYGRPEGRFLDLWLDWLKRCPIPL